ncbi:MAG: hypothetical protein HY231_22030 [Acidobacteria bacterium]|nr:hypothetical protein [Acidobacteriota bacterium]
MRRLIAEIGAVLFGLFAMILSGMIFVASYNNLMGMLFILPGVIFYWFGRAWMFQVLEVKRDKKAIKA